MSATITREMGREQKKASNITIDNCELSATCVALSDAQVAAMAELARAAGKMADALGEIARSLRGPDAIALKVVAP